MYPELFDKLIEHLRRLPGIGKKSAERFAFFLLDQDEEYLEEFGNTLYDLKDKIEDKLIDLFGKKTVEIKE